MESEERLAWARAWICFVVACALLGCGLALLAGNPWPLVILGVLVGTITTGVALGVLLTGGR